jgi:hypothetical protein
MVENREFIPAGLQRLCFGTTQLTQGTWNPAWLVRHDTRAAVLDLQAPVLVWSKSALRRIRAYRCMR